VRYWCAYHFVWIPKYRRDILTDEVAEYTREVINEIIAELGCESLAVNVMPGHVHVFVLCPHGWFPVCKRTSVVRLVPDRDAEAKLKALCSLASKLWNEVNYVRRRQFFESKRVDLKRTYKEFYEKYKALIGSATAQQILNKNDETWKSFFNLLKVKKEGKLSPFVMKVNPPGYRKKGKSRELWIVLK